MKNYCQICGKTIIGVHTTKDCEKQLIINNCISAGLSLFALALVFGVLFAL